MQRLLREFNKYNNMFKGILDAIKEKFSPTIHSPIPMVKDIGSVKGAMAATVATPTPTPVQELNSYQDFERVANPIFRKYDIPRPIGHGMYAGEGRLEGLGAKRNNFYNINAIDSDPNQAFDYKTPAEGIEAYAKLMSGKYELGAKGSGKFDTRYLPAYELRKDPVAMMKKIQELGYASRPDYADFIMSTPEWKSYYETYYQ